MDISENQTRTERLASQIADAILAGDLPPGTRLDEQTLADRYGVSRTPVREALRQLGTSGLIEVRPRRSAVVAELTGARLEALFVAMGEIEATCARLAALSMTPIERRRLGLLHERMGELAKSNDERSYVEANVLFHTIIYAGSHNDVLEDIASSLRHRVSPFRSAQFRAKGRLMKSHAEHEAVTRAIIGGNAMAAHSAMVGHMSLVEDAFEEVAALYGSKKHRIG
jgi:DNA-binding GntR family transcriptional regulator